MYPYLFEHLFLVLLVVYLGAGLPGQTVIRVTFRGTAKCFHSSCTIFHSHQRCARVQFLHILTSVLLMPFYFLYSDVLTFWGLSDPGEKAPLRVARSLRQ